MIALKNNFGDYIFFDVVTSYSQNLASQISQHPVDGSGTVSDNVVKQNLKIQLQGYISGADFNFSKPKLSSEDRAFIGIDQIVVESDIATEVEVNYDEGISRLLPEVASQFFTDKLPTIENINEGREATYSEKVLYSVLQSFRENKDELFLYEFDEGLIVEEIPSLFITALNTKESAETGDALTFSITLEQVTFSYLLEDEVPEDVQEDFEKKSEEKENKGGQTPLDVTEREPDVGSLLSRGSR